MLKELKLYQTTIPGVPPEILSEDAYSSCLENLQNHFADLKGEQSEEVTEAKLVVLGNGRVGKTQVCRQLSGLPYDEEVDSTHGITVTSRKWSDEQLNIWDFGGQDIYHGAHTLFMETSAVFLIAWHPDFETGGEETVDGVVYRNYPLPYWLEYVRTLGRKNSPVMVVQARCDRPEQEVHRLPVDDALLKFPSLKPCWYSAKEDRGRGALDDALTDAIRFLRDRDGVATVGAGRMRVLRKLKEWRDQDQERPTSARQHRTLSQTEFRNLCEKGGGVSSPESLLSYLHNLGVVFYQPSLFQDRIILDQSWALEAVYGVFDRRKAYPLILSQGGRFSASLLEITSWREYAKPEQRLFLSLMESCGIAFKHQEADSRLGLETEYIAPDMLPDKDAVAAQLTGRWDDHATSRRLEYEYAFLHPGLMRALLCEVGRSSHDAGVYWKYGVWIYEKSTSCRALLEQRMLDDQSGRITLKLQGSQYEQLASWLRERIEKCNRLFGYPSLKPSTDEMGPRERTLEPRSDLRQDDKVEESRIVPEPIFDKTPASILQPREPQVFISYAWGDETAEGHQRGQLVDDLCEKLGQQGVTVRRDRDEMRPGDLISEFMERLIGGDLVIAVISDKYLTSWYCMSELFGIYRKCADQPQRFLGKVVPLILPDAKLDALSDRLQRVVYWKEEHDRLTPLVQENIAVIGSEFFKKFESIGKFANNTSTMLEYLADKLQPRDFERQATEGFQEILGQIKGDQERAPPTGDG